MSKGRRDKGEAVRAEIRGPLLVAGAQAFGGGNRQWAEYGRRVFKYAANGCAGPIARANERQPEAGGDKGRRR